MDCISCRTVNAGSTSIATTYGYLAGGHGAGSTTPLVQTITQSGTTLTYTYDDAGNITSVSDGSKTISYEYDLLGQLTRVNDPYDTTAGTTGTTWKYAYDQGGNIQSKTAYAFTTGTVGSAVKTDSFSYGDTNWKDKLTAFNGVGISYDEIGNPLYDGTWSYTWAKGHQLQRISKSSEAVSFVYNADGFRVQKTATSTGTTKYSMHGRNLVHLTNGSNNLHFFYDAQNKPAVVIFNGTAYAYLYNLQGDVIGMLDSTGTKMVSYTYDAWGRMISKTGTLASTLGTLNPFRYRGYVFDEESGFYYIINRYYNPSLCRFSNPDDIGYINSDSSLCGCNLFTYCRNNPTAFSDPTGHFGLLSFLGAVVGGAIGGAVISTVSYLVDSALSGQEITSEGLTNAVVTGAVSGAAGAAIGTISCATAAATYLCKGVASLAVGVGMGVKTYIEMGDNVPEDQRISTALWTGAVTTGATFVGSLLPVYDKSYGFAGNAFTNYAGTLMVGAPAEMASVAGKQRIANKSIAKTPVGTSAIVDTGRADPIFTGASRSFAMVALAY